MIINARFLSQKLSGVQRFSIQTSIEIKKQFPETIFVSPKNILHKEIAEKLDAKVIGSFTGHLWEQIDLMSYCKKNKKLLLCLGNTGPILYKNKIITLHDIAYIKFQDSFSKSFSKFYQFFIPLIIKSSKHIFTVSNFSKNEIASYYKINPNKISVIYNAVDQKFQKLKRKTSEKYILSLSNINKQKNLISLIKAFQRLNRNDIKLYIIGASNKNFNNYNLDDENIGHDNIVFLGGNLSDSQVIQYYSDAMFFAFPSLYEGFGIPPLEAQSCGTPVLLSNIPVFNEIYGDSALYCESLDIEDISKKLNLLIENQNLRSEIRKKGFKNLLKYSWNNSAKNILNTINSLDEK